MKRSAKRAGLRAAAANVPLWVLGMLGAASLAGCGGDERRDEPMPVEESVFGDQVEQIDRASERAREMEGRMQDLNSQLDTAEGAPAADDRSGDDGG